MLVAVTIVVAVALPSSEADDPGGRIPNAVPATAMVDLAAHSTPGGPAEPGFDDPEGIEAGRDLVVLGDPVKVGDTSWLRVYVLPRSTGSGPDDIFTWIPGVIDGQDTVRRHEPLGCPPTRDNLSTIAALDPFTRVTCLGSAPFTVEGRTWRADLAVWYDVEPPWLGAWGYGATSFSLRGPAGASIEIRVPPGVEPPPPDITVRATLHVADPASSSCTRTGTDPGLPVESGEDSRLWCAAQVVADRWEPLLGPEGRPFDPEAPQLHRSRPGDICAGVNMGTVEFHMDPSALDPVWLEPVGGGRHILAWFGPELRVAFQPDLVVVDGSGRVVAREGMTVDPSADLAGRAVCPTGEGLYVD